MEHDAARAKPDGAVRVAAEPDGAARVARAWLAVLVRADLIAGSNPEIAASNPEPAEPVREVPVIPFRTDPVVPGALDRNSRSDDI